MFVNPRLGSRRCSGIWPPSKPRFWPNPVPARCPFEPRVAVLPCPEPMPRPMRLRAFFYPAGGRRLLRFIVYLLGAEGQGPGAGENPNPSANHAVPKLLQPFSLPTVIGTRPHTRLAPGPRPPTPPPRLHPLLPLNGGSSFPCR